MKRRFFLSLALISLCAGLLAAACSEEETADVNPKPVTDPQGWVTEEARRPVNLHLTWQGDTATSVTIQWTTENQDAEGYVPRVWVVPDEPDYVDHVNEPPRMIGWKDETFVDGMAERYEQTFLVKTEPELFSLFQVRLTGLKPNTRYYYRAGTWKEFDPVLGAFSSPNLSGVHTFRTGPKAGPHAQFTFVAAGDSRGGYSNISDNMAAYLKPDAAFWLFNGDMTDNGVQNQWNEWFTAMEPIIADRVLMPVQGNHEMFSTVYYGNFALPADPSLPDEFPNHDEQYREYAWSFDYGNTHVVGLGSNTEDLVKLSLDWLENDLKKASENPNIVWKVALFHHPPYSASNHGCNEQSQEFISPVLEKYGVDVVFNGHDHNYERTHPIANNELTPPGKKGVVYVIAGAFWAPGYGNGSEWWTAVSEEGKDGNYAVVDVDGPTMKITAYSGDGKTVLDEFSLEK